MASVGKLAVQLTANTGLFTKRMKGASRSVRGFSGVVSSMQNKLIGLGAAYLSFRGVQRIVQGITNGIQQASARIDELGKTGRKLGIATEELVGLRFAASEAGIETGVFDKALQRLSRNGAEAARGTGEAKDALEELGLDAKKLTQLPLQEQFLAVADAMANVHNASSRVLLSYRLFGREGASVLNMLDLGSDRLREYTAQAKALGIAITSIDAVKVEEANDAFGRIKFAIEGAYNMLAIQLAPLITEISNRIVRMGTEGESTFVDKIGGALRWLVGKFDVVRDAIWTWNLVFAGIKQIVLEITGLVWGLGKAVVESVQFAINEIMMVAKNLPMIGLGANLVLPDPFDVDFSKSFGFKEFEKRIQEARDETMKIWNAGPPSSSLDKWDEFQARANARAAEQLGTQKGITDELEAQTRELKAQAGQGKRGLNMPLRGLARSPYDPAGGRNVSPQFGRMIEQNNRMIELTQQILQKPAGGYA